MAKKLLINEIYSKYNPITHKNLNKLYKKIESLKDIGAGQSAYVTTKASKGKLKKKGTPITFTRTAGENYTIMLKHMKEGRNPIFFTSSETYAIIKYFADNLIKAFKDTKIDAAKIFENVGTRMVTYIKKHIATGRSEDGYMKPLQEKYAGYKRRAFGKQPILVRTGALRRSLTSKVGRNRE